MRQERRYQNNNKVIVEIMKIINLITYGGSGRVLLSNTTRNHGHDIISDKFL